MKTDEFLRQVTALPGVTGNERAAAEFIAEAFRPFVDEVKITALNSVIAHKKGTGPKVMFAAHMDSIGFIVTHIEKEGFLRVGRLGGVSPQEVAYTPVRFKNGVRGVFAKEEKAE